MRASEVGVIEPPVLWVQALAGRARPTEAGFDDAVSDWESVLVEGKSVGFASSFWTDWEPTSRVFDELRFRKCVALLAGASSAGGGSRKDKVMEKDVQVIAERAQILRDLAELPSCRADWAMRVNSSVGRLPSCGRVPSRRRTSARRVVRARAESAPCWTTVWTSSTRLLISRTRWAT